MWLLPCCSHEDVSTREITADQGVNVDVSFRLVEYLARVATEIPATCRIAYLRALTKPIDVSEVHPSRTRSSSLKRKFSLNVCLFGNFWELLEELLEDFRAIVAANVNGASMKADSVLHTKGLLLSRIFETFDRLIMDLSPAINHGSVDEATEAFKTEFFALRSQPRVTLSFVMRMLADEGITSWKSLHFPYESYVGRFLVSLLEFYCSADPSSSGFAVVSGKYSASSLHLIVNLLTSFPLLSQLSIVAALPPSLQLPVLHMRIYPDASNDETLSLLFLKPTDSFIERLAVDTVKCLKNFRNREFLVFLHLVISSYASLSLAPSSQDSNVPSPRNTLAESTEAFKFLSSGTIGSLKLIKDLLMNISLLDDSASSVNGMFEKTVQFFLHMDLEPFEHG